MNQQKELHIKKINAPTVKAMDVPTLMDSAQLSFHPINIVNWKDYPYAPDVQFRVAYTDDAILLHYKVTEQSVRAVAAHDNGKVWEDACVEFFISPEANDFYYNFEFNCAAKVLLSGGAPGDRIAAPDAVLQKIDRWSSLGTQPFEERVGVCSWELSAVIPYSAFFRHQLTGLNKATGNFYKCGDKLQTPHFLSWSPIELPQPKFHCPEFFGKLYFE